MVKRRSFMLLVLVASLVTFSIWASSQDNSDGVNFGKYMGNFRVDKALGGWNYSNLFQLLDVGRVDNGSTHGQLESEEVEEGEEQAEINDGEASPQKNRTVVLMWTKYYEVSNETLMDAILSGRKWDPSCCTGDDLIVTLDRTMLPRASVVVFFNYFHNLELKYLPPTRTPDQLWVLFCKESPEHSPGLGPFPNMFNWTMSYRRDSDILSPYGFMYPLKKPIPKDRPILMPGNVTLAQWVANKTDMLAGVISHCPTHSKREQLAKALQNATLPVEIFGSCGNRSICPRNRKNCDHDKFWHDLGVKYKFYFAAENALCVDYITEKFWRTLELGMVPVVYGGANYTAVAPPHSFIDVSQFKSPKEVATYLKNIAKNPKEYSKYFEWKRKYGVQLTDGWGGWCTLCKLARQYKHNPNKMDISPNKSYKDLSIWWRKQAKGSKKSSCSGIPFPF